MSDSFVDPDDTRFLDELEAQFKSVQELEEAEQQSAQNATEPAASADEPVDGAAETSFEADVTDVVAAVAEGNDTAHPLDEEIPDSIESPDQVLGDSMVDELQRMLDQVNAGHDVTKEMLAAHESDGQVGETVSNDTIDQTIAQAGELSDEMQQLASQIEAVSRAAIEGQSEIDHSAAGDDELDADDILMMAGRSAPIADSPEMAAPASFEAPDASTSPEAIGQIDEFLAGQADTAVAGEFETVNDVMSAEQAQDAAVLEAARRDDIEAPPQPVMDEEQAPAAEVMAAAAEVALSSDPSPKASLVGTGSPSSQAPQSKSSVRTRLASLARRTGKATVSTLFTVCSTLNKPLRDSSDMTRKIIGYAALITLANASMLLVGKYLLGIFG